MQDLKKNVIKQTYGHNDDFFLCHNEDTIKCTGYHFERSWGMMEDESFVITFNKADVNEKSERNIKRYHLIIRELTPEMGTLDIALNDLLRKAPKLKG